MPAVAEDHSAVAEEDLLRAQVYRLLAGLLTAPPDRQTLDAVAGLMGDSSPIGEVVRDLASAAQGTSAEAVNTEFHDLFIGLGRGELLPFGSYYLTGFLHEKPLAKLRTDMAELGLAKDPKVSEPEDHIASVLEMMAGLIDGTLTRPQPVSGQRRFFAAHVGSWASHFFRDLAAARTARFYLPVGRLGETFIAIEGEALKHG